MLANLPVDGNFIVVSYGPIIQVAIHFQLEDVSLSPGPQMNEYRPYSHVVLQSPELQMGHLALSETAALLGSGKL